ncbi:MAG: putative lipid II flippase FtsW [Clostridia bacterium]|nr:putative lipid II flippase FtsW [Clostridia bacterium]
MDIGFFALVTILLTIGLLMLFSSSYAYALAYFKDSYHFIKKQAIFAVVGFILMLIISKIDYHVYRKFAWLGYIVSVIMLVALLILPPMVEGATQKRWFAIGSFTFQPSEIAKFAIILLFSHLISANYKQMKTFKFSVLILGGLLVLVCGLVVVETHLSATILIFCIGVCLMIIGGLKGRYIGGGAAIGGGGVALIILTGVVGYGSDRFTYWIDPWADAKGKGYQTIQSLLAIGSGGLLGRGFGLSRQKYLWVPEPHNDFIFAIVCEELGLVGAMVIILLFCALVWRGFSIAMRAKDKFGALMAVGLTFQVGLQAILNILVVTNTIPNTGISLPFFSYGGTALIILMMQMGIVLSISRSSNVEKSN